MLCIIKNHVEDIFLIKNVFLAYMLKGWSTITAVNCFPLLTLPFLILQEY